MSKLAPVGLTVYTRLDHTKRTIEALQKNTLAKESNLYIFSDAPKKGDEENVSEMRRYLKTIDGFKKVTIIERKNNSRINNNRLGQQFLLDKYGAMIWLAEDHITAPGFLKFINDALVQYEKREDILCISSFTPNIDIQTDNDCFLMKRLCAWGIGIWKDRYEKLKYISKNDYELMIKQPKLLDRIKKYSGSDLLEWFKAEANGSLDGLDTKGSFLTVTDSYYCVYPKKSLVFNTGHDGSGLHSGITNKYDTQLWGKVKDFYLPGDILEEKKISQKVALFYSDIQNSVSESVLDQLCSKIKEAKVSSVSLWGTGDLAVHISEELKKIDVEINYFLNSWPQKDELFLNKKVITPHEAVKKGEKDIVICSIANRHKMLEEIKEFNINTYCYTD